MKTAICTLRSISPYSQSRFHNVEKLPKESHADYEMRTWKEKAHYSGDGEDAEMVIPPMALKMCLDSAAKRNGMKIPGKGQSRYSKLFLSGVLVSEPVPLGVTRADVPYWEGMMDSQGTKGTGGGSRVLRRFPECREWTGKAEFIICDDTITKDVFSEMLEEAGKFVGLGRFRPENGGYYGRFEVVSIKWA